MKKLFLVATMMLLTLTAGAQSIAGTWKLDEQFAQLLDAAVQNDEMKMEMGFTFTEKDAKFMIWCEAGNEEMKLLMEIYVPGTYTRQGNMVTCTFDKSKTDFDVVDLNTTDESMKSMLADAGSKAMILSVVKGEAKKELGNYTDSFGEIVDNFKSFEVKSVTESTLVIEADEVEISLVRK